MIRALAARLGPNRGPLRPVCADLASVRVREASLVVLGLTLQFVPPERRLDVLSAIRRGLVPGGALILSEKVRAEDAAGEGLLAALHEDFKRANGYSELEISQKRAALERVLVPDSLETHAARLEAAGFAGSLCWFRCLNFVSLLAWT
jgi:tRNA (cmo5U34)-methyltransferase